MASPFQQQSLRRKLVYTVGILVLFTATLVLRQASSFGMESQARDMQIREESLGEVELTGSAIRLTLTGSRGFAVCALWWTAQHKQERHEWNELEIIVRSITKLQPHFITPWLFQSWNLAYNVSVESDRIRDKYFYIARGIELLAEGERQNRGQMGHPDLRFSMGFYTQHKIGLSDEANTHRCLYQMSCIDPVERDPNRLRMQDPRTGNMVPDMERFAEFCRRHPMLVRRLREGLKRETPADVIDFLADNRKLPSRFDERAPPVGEGNDRHSVLLPPEQQYPVLTPEDNDSAERADPNAKDFDNFQVARDWYTYSVKPMPPPNQDIGASTANYDRTKYRMPRYMASLIFRGYPSRGQTYVAEYLEREGWFDREGWKITGWFPDDKFTNGGPATVGDDLDWGVRSWEKAHVMWRTHGSATGLYIDPEQLASLEESAQKYRIEYQVNPGETPTDLRQADRGTPIEKGYLAHRQLYWYDHYRSMTNFPHFYFKSQVEQDMKTVQLRKGFFVAEQLRKVGDRELALETYRDVLPKWRDIMLTHPGFRRDSTTQEDSYELALRYLELVRDLYGRRLREISILGDFLAQAALRPPLAISWLPTFVFDRDAPLDLESPLDADDAEGQPVITAQAKATARSRLGLPSLMPQRPMTPPTGPPSGAPPAGAPPGEPNAPPAPPPPGGS